MPTRKTQSADHIRSLREFSPRDVLFFLSGWTPGGSGSNRWRTWSEYLTDYRAIADELHATFESRLQYIGGMAFAERCRRLVDEQGMPTLEGCRYDQIKAYPEGWVCEDGDDDERDE